MIALLALTGLGCGEDGPELGGVTGTVTLDGEPVEGAGLRFIPQEGASVQRIAYATTNAEGHYKAVFNKDKDGVATGPCAVEITTSDNSVWKGKKYSGKELFPAKYHENYKTIEIADGANVFDFACESTGKKARKEMADDIED